MITSLENSTVKQLCRLHLKKYRTDSFLMLAEDVIDGAYRSGHLRQLIYTGEPPFVFGDSLEVSKEVMAKIAQNDQTQYAGVSKLIDERKDYGKRVFILDQLQDPLNIGRIMEVSRLFGFDSIILSENCADIYNEKCLNSCKGAIFDLNICHGDLEQEIMQLKKEGFMVYATGLSDNTRNMNEIAKAEKMAFVLGNEGSGVSKAIMDICDEVIKIDMCNIDSLNVAMAASIVSYRFRTVL